MSAEAALLTAHGHPVKTFNIYTHPSLPPEAVKVGFSWPAFFFGAIWMAVKNLWGYAAGYVALYVALHFFENLIKETGRGMVAGVIMLMIAAGYFALALVPAFKGNSWREANLVNRNYKFKEAILADSPEAALAAVSDNR